METVWDWIKVWIEEKHGDVEEPSYDQLYLWVKEARESIDDAKLNELMASMP